jgi:predicted HNH restriction endonuclease
MARARKRSYAERADYLKEAVAKRRKKLREMAVALKGGACAVCGYRRCISALEFHHPDPSQKDFGISVDGSTRSWERIKAEVEKCVLVCANCHREVHAGITQLSREIGIEK